MLNTKNYFETMKEVDISKLPETLKKGHDFILKSTENMDNWNAYDNGESTRKVIDILFVKIEDYLKSLKTKQPETNKQESKTEIKSSAGSESKPYKNNSITKQKQDVRQALDEENVELVERIPEELKFIRRCLSLHGKKKTKEDLLRFINAIHRAIIEKRVRKTSPYADQLNYIQDKLVKKYNAMTKPEPMILSDKTIAEFKEIIKSQKVLSSVTLIKRYISLNGKFGVKEKAKSLIEAMKRAIEKGKVKKSDRYYKVYDKMLTNLKGYLKNKAQKILSVEETELNGLNGILNHCGCQPANGFSEEFSGLDGIKNETPDNHVMNSMDFKEMKFETLGFKGKYLGLIGDPSRGFSAMVFGRPKMGKSFLCIDFAGYLARNHGKVLYIAKEEGLDYTLQEKLKATDVAHPNLDVTGSIPDDLSGYDFVFLDSVNKLELSSQDLETLKNNYPGISFIQIFQTTKSGTHKGNNANQHNVDVVIEIPERGKAVQNGRFNQGGELQIFEDKQNQAA